MKPSRRQLRRNLRKFHRAAARKRLKLRSNSALRNVATGRRDTLRTPSQLSFHCLRHTAATLLEQAGIARAVVQGITGHSSDAMSELYTHVGLEALAKATAALPAL